MSGSRSRRSRGARGFPKSARRADLAGFDGLEAVLGGHQHIVDLEVVDIELLANMLGDRLAEIDHETDRHAGRVGERERRCVVPEGNTDRFVLSHFVERSSLGRSESQHRRRREG
jgi:hypothetical protein